MSTLWCACSCGGAQDKPSQTHIFCSDHLGFGACASLMAFTCAPQTIVGRTHPPPPHQPSSSRRQGCTHATQIRVLDAPPPLSHTHLSPPTTTLQSLIGVSGPSMTRGVLVVPRTTTDAQLASLLSPDVTEVVLRECALLTNACLPLLRAAHLTCLVIAECGQLTLDDPGACWCRGADGVCGPAVCVRVCGCVQVCGCAGVWVCVRVCGAPVSWTWYRVCGTFCLES
jgi:hypothetical protein